MHESTRMKRMQRASGFVCLCAFVCSVFRLVLGESAPSLSRAGTSRMFFAGCREHELLPRAVRGTAAALLEYAKSIRFQLLDKTLHQPAT